MDEDDFDDKYMWKGAAEQEAMYLHFLEIILRIEDSIERLTKIISLNRMKSRFFPNYRKRRLYKRAKRDLEQLHKHHYIFFWIKSEDELLGVDLSRIEDKIKNNRYFKRYSGFLKVKLREVDNLVRKLLIVLETSNQSLGTREFEISIKKPMKNLINKTVEFIELWLSNRVLKKLHSAVGCVSPIKDVKKFRQMLQILNSF